MGQVWNNQATLCWSADVENSTMSESSLVDIAVNPDDYRSVLVNG